MFSLIQVTSCFVVASTASSSSGLQTDKGWELRVTSSDGPTARTCFDTVAPGRGAYYLAGPAKFEGGNTSSASPPWKFQGIFDGLAMVNKFELRPQDQPNKMCYSSMWMNTGEWTEYSKDPAKPPRGVLFEMTVPPRTDCFMHICDYSAPNDNNFVNMIMVGDQAVWVSDSLTMLRMDLDSMNVTGKQTWADDKISMGFAKPAWTQEAHMAAGGSAHPITRPGTHTVVEMLVEMPLDPLGKYYLDLYTFDASMKEAQNRTLFAHIENDALQYFHSYGVSANYVVLPFNMITHGIGPGHKPILRGSFQSHWKGVKVVDSKGEVQTFDDMEPFFHVHIANTFENASGITMDLGAYDDVPFDRQSVMDITATQSKAARDSPNQPFGQMRRFHFDLRTKKTTIEKLTDNSKDYDFIKINNAMNGLPYCIYYAVEWFHDDRSYASMAVMKHNICTGKKTFWAQPDVYINEPFFIASAQGGSEDDGTLVFTANDGQKGKAMYVTLDAHTFQEIERIELPNHIPFTAHGQFVPSSTELIVV
jgi:carotenoid cleavage dioxygenase-like enzyme